MGATLDRLDTPYSSVDIAEVDDGIVLLNCSTVWREGINKNALSEFARRGGSLMASDLTCTALSHFSDATFKRRSWAQSVEAVIEDPELTDLLGQKHVELNFDTALREPDVLPVNAKPLIRTADGGFRHRV